jgi:hypothetical protein
VQQWVTVLLAAGVAIFLLIRYYRAQKRSGMPVGPPVLDGDLDPLSFDDLPVVHPAPGSSVESAVAAVEPPKEQVEHTEHERSAAGPSESGLRAASKSARNSQTERVAIEVPVSVDSSAAQPPLESPSR